MGGANCESPMGEQIVRNVEVIDYAFSGPAFATFPQFLKHLADEDIAAAAALPGILSSPVRKPHKAPPTVRCRRAARASSVLTVTSTKKSTSMMTTSSIPLHER